MTLLKQSSATCYSYYKLHKNVSKCHVKTKQVNPYHSLLIFCERLVHNNDLFLMVIGLRVIFVYCLISAKLSFCLVNMSISLL